MTALLLTVGCTSKETPPPKELTIEELNAALAYIKESGMDYPKSVYELTNLPALRGRVFPVLPDGQSFTIDTDKNEVTIEMDHLPDFPDSFPRQNSF